MDLLQYLTFVFSGSFGLIYTLYGFGASIYSNGQSLVIGIIGLILLFCAYQANPDKD